MIRKCVEWTLALGLLTAYALLIVVAAVFDVAKHKDEQHEAELFLGDERC